MQSNTAVTDAEILDLFDGVRVISASEVSDEIALGHRATLDRLHALEKQDELEKKRLGQTLGWWRTDDDDPKNAEIDYSVGVFYTGVLMTLRKDDPRHKVLQDCWRHIDKHGTATTADVQQIIEQVEQDQQCGHISRKEIRCGLRQMNDRIFTWDGDEGVWETGE